jgi:prophage regulatory protein
MSKRHAEHHAELLEGLANQACEVADAPREPRRMLNEAQLLQVVPFARTTLYSMIKRGLFPKATFASPNRKFWFADQIAAWQDALETCDRYDHDRLRHGGRKPGRPGPIAAGLRG